jgi:hypothetical protein
VAPSLTPCGLAIDDRPHGLSPRQRRGRVRDVARGGDHDAPGARGTVARALLRRNPRVAPLSLGVPVMSVGADRRDCPAGELATGERFLVLHRAGHVIRRSSLTSGTVRAE